MSQPSTTDTSLTKLFTRFPRAKAFTDLFDLKLPIIQAPMAGADNNQLAISLATLGAMGSRGMGYLSASEIQQTINYLRKNTPHFNINLFIPDKDFYTWSKVDIEKRVDNLRCYLQPYYQSLGLSQLPFDYIDIPELFAEQLAIVLQEKIPCLSFVFGQLSLEVIAKCHQQGTKIIGTATTVDEAITLEKNGCDAIVVQGLEAGGHRGGFLSTSLVGQLPLLTLLELLNTKISIPMIAAGGIRDGAGMYACLGAGASAVQIGSALLACDDCPSISNAYKQLIHNSDLANIQITPAISGRQARGVSNSLFKTMQMFYDNHPDDRLPYPIPHLLTAPMRAAASKQDNAEWIAAWCGVSITSLSLDTVDTLLHQLVDDAARCCV